MRRAVICSLLLGLAACDRDTNPEHQPNMSELVGTWTQDSAGTNPSSALLCLNSNYTCVAKDYFVVFQMNGIENINGSGTWEVAGDNGRGWRVVLTIPKLGRRGVPVQNRKAPFLLGVRASRPLARRLEDELR